MYRNFTELLARGPSRPARLVIAGAAETKTLRAVAKSVREGLTGTTLVGDKNALTALLKENDLFDEDLAIRHATTPKEICEAACEEVLLSGGFLMKGLVETADLIQAILRRREQMLEGTLISHISLLELPYRDRLFGLSDTSVVISPDIDQKTEIIRAAVQFWNRMGCSCPKVAVLAAVEKVSSKMRDTLDARELSGRWHAGQIPGCVVEGPLSLDLAIDPAAATIKRYAGAVRGDADLLLAPDLTAGNLLGKCFNYTPGSRFAGFLLGTKMPVVLTSRASSLENKLLSIQVGACIQERRTYA